MSITHPLERLSYPAQKQVFVVLLVTTLVILASLQVLGGPLQTGASPMGIVSFEFAGELQAARDMVGSWGARGQVYAGLNLGLDYLFILAYASAIGLGCLLVARGLAGRAPVLSQLGLILAWGLLAAGALDALENYALIRVLLGSGSAAWPVVARWCAIPKFLFVAAGLLYVTAGALLVLATRVRRGGDSR